jgi:tetratricopeptide (TPR) repeat protein
MTSDNDFSTYLKMGLILLKKTEYEESIKQLEFAIDINPYSFEAQYLLGKCLIKRKRPKEAIIHLQKALLLKPNDIDIYYDLGIGYCQLHDYVKAIECLKKCISIDPSSLRTIRALGLAYLRNNSFNEAKYYFRKYFEKNPEDFETINQFIDLLIKNNQIEDSISYLRGFIGFDNNNNLKVYDLSKDNLIRKFGDLLLGQKRFRETKDIFGSLIFQYPKSYAICYIYSTTCAFLIVQLFFENFLEDAKNELHSFFKLSNHYQPQRSSDALDFDDQSYPPISYYFEKGLTSDEDSSHLVLKSLYKIGSENTEMDLYKIFRRLFYKLALNYYKPDYEDPESICVDETLSFYSFGLKQIGPSIRIDLAEILLKFGDMNDISLIELKKASESKDIRRSENFKIAVLSLENNLDVDFAIQELNAALQHDNDRDLGDLFFDLRYYGICDDADIHYWLADAWLRKGDLQKFSYNLLIAIDKEPKKLEFHLKKFIILLLDSQYNKHQLKKTLDDIKAQIDAISYRFENYPRIQSYLYFILGYIHERRGDNKNAIEYYTLSIKSNNKLTCVLPYLGKLYVMEGNFHQAISALTWGRENSQKSSNTYKKCTELLGEMAIAQENWKDAHLYYKELSKLYPNNDTFYEKSLSSYTQIQKIMPDQIPIPDEERNAIEKEINRWEELIRQIIIKKAPNYWEKLENDDDLKIKINLRIDEYISKKPHKSRNEINPIDFFDVRDYLKIIKRNQELKNLFGSQEILKLNSDCIAELRNIIKHNRDFDFSDYYHGKAALYWFNEISKKIT